MAKERLIHIDIAKALCIVLVAAGHFNPDFEPSWWRGTVRFIYSFHMPAFMFLSGLLYASSKTVRTYPEFLANKFIRLMVPYFCASAIIIGIKLLTQSVLPVKNTVSAFAFVEMFFKPSAAVHLWFIWVLMEIFIIVPIIKSDKWLLCLLFLSLVLWITGVSLPQNFALYNLPRMMVFFICGVLYVKFGLKTPEWPWIVLPFIALSTVYLIFPTSGAILKYILPFFGIGTVLVTSRKIASYAHSTFRNALIFLGESSFFIYLFHTTCSEFAKAVLSKIGITPSSSFIICLLICILSGLVIPLIIDGLFVRRFRLTSFIFGSQYCSSCKSHRQSFPHGGADPES